MGARSILAASAAVLLTACAPLRQSVVPASVGEQEVSAFLAGYLDAIASRDDGRIRAALVTDERFAWIEDGKLTYRNADEVLAGLATFPTGSTIRTELTDLAVVPVGPSGAHAWATFRTSVGDGPAGFSFGGAISFVLERDGGSWKIVGGHTSTPRRR